LLKTPSLSGETQMLFKDTTIVVNDERRRHRLNAAKCFLYLLISQPLRDSFMPKPFARNSLDHICAILHPPERPTIPALVFSILLFATQ